jgi:hypothetical protein
MRQTLAWVFVVAILTASAATQDGVRPALTDRVRALTRESAWRLAASVPVAFRTHHPQGMVRIGETLFVSSVEVTVRTRRFPQRVDGYDRDTGEGVGHLFRMDMSGKLLAHIRLGEGTMYHPGGIDFDGTHIWVPVAEYRPDGRTIVYRVDPGTMKATEVFRFPDHIGAIVRNTDGGTLHGASWGSRRFYRWTLGADGTVSNAGAAPESLRTANPSHYVDYQDCAYAGEHTMLCTGVADLRRDPDTPPFRLGGLDLVDLRDGRPVHQVPVPLWTAGGLPLTQNPVWIEPHGRGLRAYFMPEDDVSTVYIYDVEQ